MTEFSQMGLSPQTSESLKNMGYTSATPIQAQAIPAALKGRDIMGSAQTGTGKTAAFAIPVIEGLRQDKSARAIIITPTRELAKQILTEAHQLIGRDGSINTACIIGGESIGKQFKALKGNARLIVGTPGRINDHLERGSLNLSQTRYLVLDETDRMLDMGFTVQIDRILKFMPKQRQTMMFSATMPPSIIKLSQSYFNNPKTVSVGSTTNPVKGINQNTINVSNSDKFHTLTDQLQKRDGSIVVFVKTKRGTDRLVKKLNKENFDAKAIHGGLSQNKRNRVIKTFRGKDIRILVGTDVIARGLDVPHIEHVINYDLPQIAEDYIHRIGRTARGENATGEALSLITPQDGKQWKAIRRLLDDGQESGSSHGGNGGGHKHKSHKRKRKNRSRRRRYNKAA